MRFFVLFVLVCISSFHKVSSASVVIDGAKDIYNVSVQCHFLEDSSGKLSYDEVTKSPYLDKFKTNTDQLFPYKKHPVWLKLSVNNISDKKYLLKIGLIGTLKLDAYRIANGDTTLVSTGVLRPIENKEELINYFTFQLPKGQVDYWVRVETWPSSFVPLEVVKASKLELESHALSLINGIYLGVILLVCLFCFYYYLIFKELIYLAYIAWVWSTSFFMFYINGFFNEYIAQYYLEANLWYPASLIISTFFYFAFIIVFLQLKRYSKFFYYFFIVSAILQVLLLIAFCFGYSTFEITQFLGSILNLIVLGVAIYVLIKGHKPALYLIVATVVLFTGGFISVMAVNNVLPLNPFTSNALQLSLILEIFLFTMGLVGKSFNLKKETIATQAKIIEVMHDNERIIQENTANLERLVKERTREIEEQNHELKQQHEELKILSERVHEQNELLDGQNSQLKNYNEKLEERVAERTHQLKMSSEKLLIHYKKLEQYSYITSHNLRGPIARLLGLYNILDKSKIKDPESQLIINHMNNTAMAMDRVVKDLSKILEINNRKNDDYVEIFLSDLFNSIKETLNMSEIEDMKLSSDFSAAPSIFSVKPYIQSLFYNLLSNSIKYRFPFRPLEIFVRSYLTEKETVLEFTDNGMGIDMETAGEKMFQPFQRFHEKVIDGSGFGLFLVKLQMDNLGAEIEVKSEVNIGTVISVYLPFEQSVPIE